MALLWALAVGGAAAQTAQPQSTLSGAAAVAGSNTVPICQVGGGSGCNSTTANPLVNATFTQIYTFISGLVTSTANLFTAGQGVTPSALTNASTIAVNAALSNKFTLLLSATGQTMGCPTGVATGTDKFITIDITQPASGGPDDLKWDPCYQFTAGTPPIQSNNGLSAAAGVTDVVTCDVIGGTPNVTHCPINGGSNMASSAQFLLRSNHVVGAQSGTGTSYSVTIANSMPGDLRTVAFNACQVGGCAAGTALARATSVTDGINACTSVTNAFSSGTNGIATDIWKCPKITGGASSIVMVTWPAAVSNGKIFVQEWVPSVVSPDAGIGNNASGTTANPSITTASATAQAGELVLSIISDNSALTANVGTLIDHDASSANIVQYQTPAVGSVTNSATAAAGTWSASLAGFLHY